MLKQLFILLSIATFIQMSAANLAGQTERHQSNDSESWVMYGRDLQNTNHYPHATASSYEVKWSVRAGCPAPGMSSALVDARATYNTSPCSNTGDTHAVGLNGEVLWSHGVGEGNRGIISSPCIHGDVLYTVDNGFIKALSANEGSLIWKEEVRCGKVSISSPIVYEGKLFLSGTEGIQVMPIDRTKSAQDALIEIEGCHGASTPAFHNDAMIALSLDRVHSYDTNTLELNWEVEMDMRLKERLVNSPVIDLENERVFVTSSMPYQAMGRLYCLSLKDGAVIWQQDNEGVGITPAITFDGKQVYLASMNGTVTAFDPKNGEPSWKWTLPGETETKDGKVNHSRILGGLISSNNKLVFATRSKLFIISNDHPEKIDFEIDLNGFGASTPTFYNKDLYVRYRSKKNGAQNYCYTEK